MLSKPHTRHTSANEPKPATVIVKMILIDCIRHTEEVVDVGLPIDVYDRMKAIKS